MRDVVPQTTPMVKKQTPALVAKVAPQKKSFWKKHFGKDKSKSKADSVARVVTAVRYSCT
jgi:hypothetical protein